MSAKKTAPTYMFVFREPATPPDWTPGQMQQIFQQWMDWVARMRAKGQYVAGDPLEPAPARILRGLRGTKVTDGPFVEAKEIVGGYMLIKARSLAAAAKIAQDCPGFAHGGSVEIRQIMPVEE
ncbi:MAG: hypothetical protein HZA93_26920 [Verrucomicrobia bacterium]|nr:hypothetical protein [Verrucomicrobiota bacterium]